MNRISYKNNEILTIIVLNFSFRQTPFLAAIEIIIAKIRLNKNAAKRGIFVPLKTSF
jgi:hypothetical protein